MVPLDIFLHISGLQPYGLSFTFCTCDIFILAECVFVKNIVTQYYNLVCAAGHSSYGSKFAL